MFIAHLIRSLMGSMMLFPLSDPSPSSSMILVALDPQKPLPYEFRQERKHHNIFFNAADILTKYEKEQLSLDNIVIHDFNLHSEKIDKIDMHQYIRWIEYNRRFKAELSFLQYHHLEKDVAGAIVELSHDTMKDQSARTVFIPYSWMIYVMQVLSTKERDSMVIVSPVIADIQPSLGNIGYILEEDIRTGSL